MKEVFQQATLFLKNSQQKDGSFASYSFEHAQQTQAPKVYHTTLTTSLILSCLTSLPETQELRTIKEQAANFLLKQKSPQWSFNYWDRTSKQASELPYPDDLDDTFCALAALYLYKPELITGEALGFITQFLIATERQPGGPYKTWLVDADAPAVWQDIDLAVNCNVGYFLHLQEVSLPNLQEMMDRTIQKEEYSSVYYPAVYPILYFLSRFYQGDRWETIVAFLKDKQEPSGAWENPLYTALAASTLLKAGVKPIDLDSSSEYLLKTQHAGKWKLQAFCLDPAIEKSRHYAGAPALTTAFCLEALTAYNQANKQILSKSAQVSRKDMLYQRVIERVRDRISQLDEDLRTSALNCLATMLAKDTDQQIVLLALSLRESIFPSLADQFSDQQIVQVGCANLYGWIAYTIYDDFLDEEGKPALLPVANVCLRELTSIFQEGNNPEFKHFFHSVMDRLEAANSWELAHCRFTSGNLKDIEVLSYDYERLADRSLGHVLAPLSLLFHTGFTEKDLEVSSLLIFFRHYLIARQLLDDAHDWENDLRRGQINAVAMLILSASKKPSGKLSKTLPRLQKLFWSKTIVTVHHIIEEHLQEAERALLLSPAIIDTHPLKSLLSPLTAVLQRTMAERARMIDFLQTF